MYRKIKVNKLQCPKCKDIVESKYGHDFVWCKCGNIAADGGKNYLRRVGDVHNYIELSEYEGDENDSE